VEAAEVEIAHRESRYRRHRRIDAHGLVEGHFQERKLS
jgi:hypothetical protein